MANDITVVPANEATADDLRAILGERGTPHRCQCQWFKYRDREFTDMPVEERARRLHEQTRCGDAAAEETTGLVAYLDGEPAGWCAVEPRVAYPRMLRQRIPWKGREEDRTDPDVWVVSCFVTRAGFRRRGVSSALASATVDFARARGARALEGYPRVPDGDDEKDPWGELYVGTPAVFSRAGFTEVTRPGVRRLVMRIDL